MFSKLFFLVAAMATAVVETSANVVGRDDAASNPPLMGTHTGDGTHYDPSGAPGACGHVNQPSDHIVALGHNLFDSHPAVCGRTLTAYYNGKFVKVKIQDRCAGCATYDLDFSPSAFKGLAPLPVGRIHGVKWQFD